MIPDEAVDRPNFDLLSWWPDRDAPLVVEIGSGIGEATAALAAARPDVNVLAFEVWRPGIADSLWRVAEAGADNVRFCGVDAVWSLEHLLGPDSISELWTFFPDPWHKTKHHKRRLVTAAAAAMVASRLAPGRALAAGHRLGRLRRADGRGARRGAAARPAAGRAVGGPSGDPLRAQGPRQAPRDHRPHLHPGLSPAPVTVAR